MKNYLRPVLQKVFRFNATFGVVLLLAFCIPRFYFTLQANVTANYGLIGIFMMGMMMIVPLNKMNRTRAGVG